MNHNFLLWPLLAVWMGLAFVVLFTIVGVIAWSTVHLVRDAIGVRDAVYCPMLKRDLRVKAIPRHFFRGGLRFSRLRRCERFGSHTIDCSHQCLEAESFAV